MTADTIGLYQAWLRSRKLAQKAVSEVSERCEEYARTVADYYAAKARRTLEMRADGEPVGVVEMRVKGDPDVVDKLFAMTLAEGKYKAAMKAIDVYRDDSWQTFKEYERSMQGDSYVD